MGGLRESLVTTATPPRMKSAVLLSCPRELVFDAHALTDHIVGGLDALGRAVGCKRGLPDRQLAIYC